MSNEYHEIIRFDKGDKVIEGLKKFIEEKKIKVGWVWMLGSASAVELAYYYLLKKEYENKRFEESLEVVDVQGNIARKDGEVALHLHGTFGRTDFSTISGHVNEIVAAATVEVFIHKIEGKLTRAHDEVTGLSLLQ